MCTGLSESNATYILEEIAHKLEIDQGTVSRIMQKFKTEDLHKIAKELSLTGGRISQILNKFKTEEIKELLRRGNIVSLANRHEDINVPESSKHIF